jgi:hypothetical protein
MKPHRSILGTLPATPRRWPNTKSGKARLEEDADDADVEERPDDLPDDVPAKATITIKEINDNRYYYCNGEKVTKLRPNIKAQSIRTDERTLRRIIE